MNELKKISLDLKKKIEDYSSFDLVMIGEVLAKITSHYENESYSYQQTYYFCKDNRVGGGIIVVEHPAIIIDDSVKRRFYSFNTDDLDKLKNDGKALILIDNLKNNSVDSIKFYYFNDKTNELKLNVNFGKFKYLKEFINKLIIYKLKNNINDISNEELENIMNDFINENSKKLIKN